MTHTERERDVFLWSAVVTAIVRHCLKVSLLESEGHTQKLLMNVIDSIYSTIAVLYSDVATCSDELDSQSVKRKLVWSTEKLLL